MNTPTPKRRAFAAMRHSRFRWFFGTYIVAMMADNIEHVISYWAMYEKFESPALAGFAVLSHWLPFLFFSIPMGGLADRIDPRRLIQIAMAVFACVSLAWGYLLATDSLQMWQAMLLLVMHGCAGVFWQTPSQLLLHSMVEPEDLQSAVRLNATARYLGMLVGPALGGAMLVWLGPVKGILLNALYFLPVIAWLAVVPYRRETAAARAVRGFADVARTLREISKSPAIVTMTVLAATASAFIGNSYHAQMPNFAKDLGQGDPGVAYSMLLAADAAGALTAGFLLETLGGFRTTATTALLLAMGWCVALASFALTANYTLALALLFAAGFFELSFSSMAQAVVQIEAPGEIRGRVLGVFAMAALGCRAFAGITVGLLGSLFGVHLSLALAGGMLFVIVTGLYLRNRVILQ